ncbi:MAG: YihY/virulence factor BrkB family protein [Planctomycetota bacterium]|nr:YihY/virulence factor BrkB family protein [Planctomycetota bacterium]
MFEDEERDEPATGSGPGTPPDLRGRSFAHLRASRRRDAAAHGRLGRSAQGVHAFFTRELWARELTTLPTLRRWTYGVARVVQLTLANFVKDRCTWRAAALTYITVLSLVPMLAFAFSVAKGLGAYEQLERETIVPFLDATFGEAGVAAGDPETSGSDGADAQQTVRPEAERGAAEGGAEVRRAIDTVLDFVQRTDVSKLGALGFLLVLYTVVKLLGAIEHSFNDIWGVRKARSLPRKIADYFSTVVMVPLLLITGTTVLNLARTGYPGGEGASGPGSALWRDLSSLALVWLGFALSYVLMPNTRTRITSALVGGVVGGSFWQLFQWAHLELQLGVATYNAIYSTFAALPIFLFWVHTSWMTVLLGAEAASAHQNQARHGQLVRSRDYDLARKELLALRLVARVTQTFLAGEPPRGTVELADELGCPERTLEEVRSALEEAGLIALTDADADAAPITLTVDPGIVRIQDVLDALKGSSVEEREVAGAGDGPELDAHVERAFGAFRRERDAGRANLTLRDLARDEEPAG